MLLMLLAGSIVEKVLAILCSFTKAPTWLLYWGCWHNWTTRNAFLFDSVFGVQAQVGKVIRLRKIISGSKNSAKNPNQVGKPILSEEEQILWAEWPSVAGALTEESMLQAYARDVMSPLLGPDLVDAGVLVSVSTKFLECIAHKIAGIRPSWRSEVSHVNTCSGTALLISDHSMLWPSNDAVTGENGRLSVSVEVKPKCGFLPDSALIADENFIKRKVSRFTMHQILKLSKQQIKRVSHYSPLDLFSGNLERINQAVENLFENPQNNLRVFIDGKSVIVETNSEYPDWELLDEALGNCISGNKGARVHILKRLVSQILYESSALKHLLAAQKLDVYDIEGAIRAYDKFCQKGTRLVDKNNIDTSFLDSLTMEESMKVLRDYLIAATAKDCSLMVTVQELPSSVSRDTKEEDQKVVHCPQTGKSICYKIHFVDLDLKPLHKMPHYFQLDQEIVKAYQNMMGSKFPPKLSNLMETQGYSP